MILSVEETEGEQMNLRRRGMREDLCGLTDAEQQKSWTLYSRAPGLWWRTADIHPHTNNYNTSAKLSCMQSKPKTRASSQSELHRGLKHQHSEVMKAPGVRWSYRSGLCRQKTLALWSPPAVTATDASLWNNNQHQIFHPWWREKTKTANHL